jgi:hypothetical protein
VARGNQYHACDPNRCSSLRGLRCSVLNFFWGIKPTSSGFGVENPLPSTLTLNNRSRNNHAVLTSQPLIQAFLALQTLTPSIGKPRRLVMSACARCRCEPCFVFAGGYTIRQATSCQSKTALRGFSPSPAARIDRGSSGAGASSPGQAKPGSYFPSPSGRGRGEGHRVPLSALVVPRAPVAGGKTAQGWDGWDGWHDPSARSGSRSRAGFATADRLGVRRAIARA